MSPSRAVALQWSAVAASVILLGLLMLRIWHAVNAAVVLLDRLGWSTFVGRPATRPTAWLISCLSVPGCPHAFTIIWTAYYPRWETAVAMSAICAAGLFRLLAGQIRHRSALPPGAARWAHPDELLPFIQGEHASPPRGYIGVLAPVRRLVWWSSDPPILRLPERLRCSHCLVVGGSGARKTTGYHKPNVLLDALDGVSVVIFDLKYPDAKSGFWDCVPYFARREFDVQLFLPFDRQTLTLPLLADIHTLEDAYDVVDLLLPPPLHEHAANFYRDQERQLLVGLLLGVARDRLRNADDAFSGVPSLRRLFRLCLSGIGEIERYVHTHPDAQVREAVAGLFELEPRLLAGIAAGVAGRLQLFNDDRLERATTAPADLRGAVRLEQLGTAPTLLYIGIPQEKVQGARGQLVLQLLKRTVERALLRTADRNGGALPRHVSIYLDEFSAMGPLPNVAETMATMRSRRVAYHLSLQNRAQGEMLYGAIGFRSFFVNTIQTVIIFPRFLKFDDAQYFSEMLGYMTLEQRSTGLTRRGLLGGSRTDWSRETLRPLVPPEEYPDWPEPMGILFTIGARPARVLLPRVDEEEVAGVRNPFLGFQPYLTAPADEAARAQQITELIGHHVAWTGAHQSLSSQEPQDLTHSQVDAALVSSARPPIGDAGSGALAEPSADQSTPSPVAPAWTPAVAAQTYGVTPPGPELISSLRDWVHELILNGLPPGAVRAYFHNGRLTWLGLCRVALPSHQSIPLNLSAWIAHRWVRVSLAEIGLLPRGFQMLPREALAALRRAGSFHPQGRGPWGKQLRSMPSQDVRPSAIRPDPPRLASPPTVQPTEHTVIPLAIEALRHLRAWVESHGAHLQGRPQWNPQVELLGLYRAGRAVVIRAETVNQVLAAAGILPEQLVPIRAAWRDAGWIRVDAHHLTTVRRLGGKRHRVVEVLWDGWTTIQCHSDNAIGPVAPAREPVNT